MEIFKFRHCEISKSADLGRFLVASKDIKAGELLLQEKPSVVGPYWGSSISCLNCFGEVTTVCRNCKKAPICLSCFDKHNTDECRFFQQIDMPPNFLLSHFDIVTPLRFLFFLQNVENGIETTHFTIDDLLNMECHCEKRRNSTIWNHHQTSVVNAMQQISLYDKFVFKQKSITVNDDFIHRLIGILDVNSFDVRTPNCVEFPIRGLYPEAALMAHNCVANTFIAMDSDKVLKVYSSIDIKSGESIFVNYTDPLLGTTERREHLLHGKYFYCECQRCCDPTELGTHMSSIYCPDCTNGIVTHCKALWHCGACKKHIDTSYVESLLKTSREEANDIRMNVDNIERFIDKYHRLLHPNHYIQIEMKQKLATIIRQMCESTPRQNGKNKILLQRKIEICHEIELLVNVLQPGLSRLKGIVLYEQFTSKQALDRCNFGDKSIIPIEYFDFMCTTEAIAKEAIQNLIYEPATNPEGILAKRAMHELKQLREEKLKFQKSMKRLKN